MVATSFNQPEAHTTLSIVANLSLGLQQLSYMAENIGAHLLGNNSNNKALLLCSHHFSFLDRSAP